MTTIFLINVLLASVLFHRQGNNAMLVGERIKANDTLTKLSKLQYNYKINNGKYASTFEELDYAPSDILERRYTYIMLYDYIKPPQRPAELPSYINVDNKHIYSIICINMHKNIRDCDTLSVDFNGNVELLESFNYFPLPEPKWHEWK